MIFFVATRTKHINTHRHTHTDTHLHTQTYTHKRKKKNNNYMGGGFLPVTIHNGELYFLFGRENEFADTPGFSDFGGGQDHSESCFTTALREFVEETSGFMGTSKFIRQHLRQCGLTSPTQLMSFDLPSSSSSSSPSHHNNKTQKKKKKNNHNNIIYRMFLFPIPYSSELPLYYNHMQQFLKKKLPKHFRKTSKVFEKDFIRWFSWKELQSPKTHSHFRSYFRKMFHNSSSSSFLSSQQDIFNHVQHSLATFFRHQQHKQQ